MSVLLHVCVLGTEEVRRGCISPGTGVVDVCELPHTVWVLGIESRPKIALNCWAFSPASRVFFIPSPRLFFFFFFVALAVLALTLYTRQSGFEFTEIRLCLPPECLV